MLSALKAKRLETNMYLKEKLIFLFITYFRNVLCEYSHLKSSQYLKCLFPLFMGNIIF